MLLVFSIILSVVSFYIGFIRPSGFFTWFARGSCLIATFLLIPTLSAVLYYQSTAIGRLSETGFIPFPGITETVGIAYGKGENPVWIFKFRGRGDIEEFYRDESNREGWTLKENVGNLLVFIKDNKKMSIGKQEGWTSSSIIYMMESN